MRIRWMIFIIWLTGVIATYGREIPRTVSFTKERYEAQNQNWMLSLLHDQVLAAANSAGLMFFDGSRWSIYPMPDNQIVRAVATDEAGAIFCGGYGSFGFWKGDERGRLTYHDLSLVDTSARVANGEIWNILALPGRVIFQSFSEIYLYDYQQVRTLVPPGTIMFISEVDGRLLVPSVQHGIFELLDDGSFQLLPGTEALAGERVAAILPKSPGEYLIGTQKSGLYRYKDARITPLSDPLHLEIRENQLNRGLRLSTGNYAFGTILDGVYITDSTAQKVLFHLNKENGLQNNTVLSLLEDPARNLWVGMDRGITYVKLNEPLVYYNDEQVDIGTVYSAVIHRDDLYVGSNQGVFYQKLNGAGDRLGKGRFQLIPGSQGQVWQLSVIGEELLVGHNLGTFLIEDHQFQAVSPQVGAWYTIPVPGRQDRLLQATYTGMAMLKKNAEGQWAFSHELPGFARPLKKILFDEEGHLWGVNPHKGLFRFELSADQEAFVSIKRFTQEDGLPTEYRPDIFLVDRQLLIKAGDVFLRPADDGARLTPVDFFAGIDLAPGSYKLICFSRNEYFKVYPDYVDWFYGGKERRLDVSLVANYERIVGLTNDLVLFCLDQGYSLLDRNRAQQPPRTGSYPLISEIKVNGDHSLYPLFQPDLTEPWTFGPAEKHLQFFIGLPQFSRNAVLECRLVGYEQSWRTLNNHFSEFTNLPPGDYQFQVREQGAATSRNFIFSILPKWYQTIWATILYFLAIALGLWALFIFQQRRLKLQLRKLHLEKERQLHMQRIQARNEQLQANILNKSKELASTTMNLIQKNEILIKIKEQLSAIKSNGNKASYHETQKLIHLIDHHLTNEQDWELFEKNFSQVHETFLKKLKQDYPELTPGDLKLAAYLKMNLSSKEIAPLLNISIRGVENKRYRLRSKLGLESGDNLTEFMMRY